MTCDKHGRQHGVIVCRHVFTGTATPLHVVDPVDLPSADDVGEALCPGCTRIARRLGVEDVRLACRLCVPASLASTEPPP